MRSAPILLCLISHMSYVFFSIQFAHRQFPNYRRSLKKPTRTLSFYLNTKLTPKLATLLVYRDENDELGNIFGTLRDKQQQIKPIASIRPPEYIHGFERIIIRFLDNQIIEFVKNIGLEEINLSFNNSLEKLQENDEQLMLMRNLLTILANNICELQIYIDFDRSRLLDFNRLFPKFIDQVPFLDVPIFVSLDLDILFNWLMKPLINGKQKILYYINFDQIEEQRREMELRFINRIKEEFSQSTEKKNFLVGLELEYDQFNMQNEQTGEVLNLYQEMTPEGLRIFLTRYPKGEEHWKEGSDEKIVGKENTKIQVADDDKWIQYVYDEIE